jgi:hypothetical protein
LDKNLFLREELFGPKEIKDYGKDIFIVDNGYIQKPLNIDFNAGKLYVQIIEGNDP